MKFSAPEIKLDTNQRRVLMKELYEHYETEWKFQTWQNYKNWLAQNKLKPCFENQEKFKKSAFYFIKITPKSFASFWLGHIPTNDLHYLVSIAKDKRNRKESFNRWLFWALKNPSQTAESNVTNNVQ